MATVRWNSLQTVVLLWLLLLFPGEALQDTESSTELPKSSPFPVPPRGRQIPSTLVATAPSSYYPRGTGVGSWLELGLFGTQQQQIQDPAARSGRNFAVETTTPELTTDPASTSFSPALIVTYNHLILITLPLFLI